MCIILAILRSEEITATSVAHILKIMKAVTARIAAAAATAARA